MADLRPIGSEKLEGTDKLKRIMEIANYGRTSSQKINESTGTVDYTIQLADGNFYGIVKEKNGYIVKKGINESELDYSEPMKNRKYYSSYSQAMKKVNLIASELNRLHENEEGISLIGEQKKFVLKTPKAEPEMSAEPTMDIADEPEMDLGSEEMDLGGEEMDLGSEEMDLDNEEMDLGDESPEDVDDEDLSFKTIQKITGKLGQKLRTIDSRQGLSSEDIKYVVNSVLSAVDLTKLTEEDYEDVMENFEEVEGEVDDNEETVDMDMEMSGDEEGGEEELDLDLDMEVEPEMGEMKEYFYDDMDLGDGEKNKFDRDRYALHQYGAGWFDEDDRRMDDFEDYDEEIEFGPEDYEKFLELSPENARWNPKMDKHYYDMEVKNQHPLKLRIKRAMGEGMKKMVDELFNESVIKESDALMSLAKKIVLSKKYDRLSNELDPMSFSDEFEFVDNFITYLLDDYENEKYYDELYELIKDEYGENIMSMYGGSEFDLFGESKVEKVLSKYFVITEDEKKVMKEKQTKKYLVEKAKASLVKKEIKKLSETVEQELTSNVLMKEGKNVKFLGKTNKKNLLFEMEGKKVKISTKGEII